MMIVGILGGAGNMGTRYAKIVRELGHQVEIFDINIECSTPDDVDVERLIITLPTDAHLSCLMAIANPGLAILCEKPISRYSGVIGSLKSMEQVGINLQMVDQYAFCPRYPSDREGTMYHSWHSGTDTLPWDCINIIAKANDLTQCTVSNSAPKPHWECRINGEALRLEDMAGAYKAMLEAWLKDPQPNYSYMKHAHERVLEFIACQKTVQ